MKKQNEKKKKAVKEKKPGFFETLLGPDPRYDDDYYEEGETREIEAEQEVTKPEEARKPEHGKKKREKHPAEPKIKRGSRLKRMKVKYFFAVIAIYILSFFALYGIASIFLTIWPVHPYLNLIIVIVLAALASLLASHIANNSMQSHWLRHQD